MNKITIDDLPAMLSKQLKKENNISTRNQALTKNDIRTYYISVMNILKNITPSERERVLNQALKLNKI